MKLDYDNVSKQYHSLIQKTVFEFIKKHNINPNIQISISFVSKRKIRYLNKKYRHIDASTDVLTFPIWPNKSDIPQNGKINLGDIFVCLDFAQESISDLIEHSLNHLIGKHH